MRPRCEGTGRRHRGLLGALCVLLLGSLTGCSLLPTWLGGSTEAKFPPLPPIEGGTAVPVLWQVSVGARQQSLLTPALLGDRIVAAHPDGTVVVVDARSGAVQQRFSTGTARGALAGGVAAREGLIVVTTAGGWALAFDETGRRLWEARLPTEAISPAALTASTVVVVTIDGGVTGLDARTGARRWFLQRQLPALTLRAAAPPKAAGELVYWGTPSGRLLALDASNGAVLWENTVATPRGTSELERLIDVLGQPSLGNNRVCAAAYQGRIACFDAARGTLLWHRDISSLVGTLMDERFVYSVDEKGVAYALDLSTGATVWRRDVLAGRRASGLALLGERLAIQDMQGHVHVLDRANGRILARALGEGFESLAPLVASAHAFVTQTRSGQLVALAAR